ncbi:MAG: hypothetical protein V4710_18720, partial [Verrucomicrobiota bacterium]
DYRLRLAAARFGASFRILDDPESLRPTTNPGIMVPGNFVNRGYCTSCVLAAAWVFLMAQSPFRKTILLLPSGNFYDVVQLMKDELPEDPIRISEGDEVTAIDAVAFRRESATIQSWEAAAIQWMKGELGPKRFAHPDMLRNDAIHT